jgi:hypothetical protein
MTEKEEIINELMFKSVKGWKCDWSSPVKRTNVINGVLNSYNKSSDNPFGVETEDGIKWVTNIESHNYKSDRAFTMKVIIYGKKEKSWIYMWR